MKAILRIFIFVPLALLLMFFSLANRGPVRVSFDLFAAGEAPAASIEAPLFMVVLAAMAIGVLAGGVSSWLGHLPVRRAAKVARAEAKKTRVEIEKLRQQALAQLPTEAGAKGGKR